MKVRGSGSDRVYLDANILIAAATGRDDVLRAMQRMAITGATFVTSDILRMEVIPTRMRDGQRGRAALVWLNPFFDHSDHRRTSSRVIAVAHQACADLPLSVADALHLAHAHLAGVDTLWTLEEENKPMHLTRLLTVRRLDVPRRR